MEYASIKPFLHEKVEKIINNTEKLFDLSWLHNGPIHVLVPEIMNDNIKAFNKVFDDLEMNWIIKYAHKTNKSKALLFQAYKNNLWVDVASEEELKNVLSVWFTWDKISCTWPKSKSFLFLALSHKCLISIDNLDEIKKIIELSEKFNFKKVNILIRFHDLSWNDRKLVKKNTKFWISKNNLLEVLDIIKDFKFIDIKWVHFHYDEHQHEIKSWSINDALSVIKKLYENNYSPTIIDIWWGFRGRELDSKLEWSNYIDFLSDKRRKKFDTHTWWNWWYWIKVNERWWIDWREFVEKRYIEVDNYDFLSKILKKDFKNWYTLYEEINDSMLNLMIEPWYSLSSNTWFSIFRVDWYKTVSSWDEAIIINWNILNLSSKMWEYFADPIHLIKDKKIENNKNNLEKNINPEEFYWYILWNLCRDDDILIKRKIYFKQKPEEWDLIIFPNTSSYVSDFEDWSPIMQNKWKKFVATVKEWNVKFYEDNLYNLINL